MLKQTIQDALNEQIKHEMYASQLYLAMSAYCEANRLPGCARWLRIQSEEEREHALRIFDFISDRDGRVTLQAIGQPPFEFETVMDVFDQTLEHERKVTAAIHRIYELAVQEQDYPTQVMLQWFINEQVEEEKNAQQVIDQLRMVGLDGPGLYMLDRDLGGRTGEEEE